MRSADEKCREAGLAHQGGRCPEKRRRQAAEEGKGALASPNLAASLTETGVAFTGSPTFPGQTAKRKHNTLNSVSCVVQDGCTHPLLYASDCQGAPELEGSRGPIWFPCLQEVSFFSHLQEGEGQAGGLPSPSSASHAVLTLPAPLLSRTTPPILQSKSP